MAITRTYESINYNGAIPNLDKPGERFHITCPPDTDVWEKPPSVHSFNAPIIYTTTNVSSFKSTRATVTGAWKEKYDQGGLILIINSPDGTRRWVKTGIEFLNGKAHVSVVATDRWSDWSLRPTLVANGDSAQVEIAREDDGSLWVWLIGEHGEKEPAREIAWWGDLEEDAEVWVGVYAAKPAKEKTELVVDFKDFSATLR